MDTVLPRPLEIRYADDSPAQVIDLFRPAAADLPVPLVVAVHGGAFMMGDRHRDLYAAPLLLEHGFAVASVGYRLSGAALFPAAVQDVKRAVAVLRARSLELGLDPSRFAAWGRSAGGHLSAMLGVTGGRPTEFDRAGDDSHVHAVVDWYGPSDFLRMDQQFIDEPPTGDGPEPQQHDPADSPESKWLGAAIQTVPDVAVRSNPISWVTADAPPFFLATGTNDRLVPHQQTLILADALRAHDVAVRLEVLAGADHGDRRFEQELTAPAIDWLERVLATA
jgi:acetyl esterase/lipase